MNYLIEIKEIFFVFIFVINKIVLLKWINNEIRKLMKIIINKKEVR